MHAEQQQLFQRQSLNIIWVVHYLNVHNAAIWMHWFDTYIIRNVGIEAQHN
jgi:hypothetical protein